MSRSDRTEYLKESRLKTAATSVRKDLHPDDGTMLVIQRFRAGFPNCFTNVSDYRIYLLRPAAEIMAWPTHHDY